MNDGELMFEYTSKVPDFASFFLLLPTPLSRKIVHSFHTTKTKIKQETRRKKEKRNKKRERNRNGTESGEEMKVRFNCRG